jgi:GTPase involved in cell partitioning and DNA repair
MIRPAEIVSLYVPILFLKSFNTRDKTNQVKVKLIEKLRDRPIRKEHLEKLAQKLFKKFDTNIHEVETKEQSILNIYHDKVIYLTPKQKKSKKDKSDESNKTQTIQEHHQDKQSQTEIPDEFI